MVDQLKSDYRNADVDAPTRALLDACVQLTRAPWTMTAAHVAQLRRHGLDDEAIHDAFQIAAYFNYINRICDGLGVDLEDSMPREPASWKQP